MIVDLEKLNLRLDQMVVFGLDIGPANTGGVRMVAGEIVADFTLQSKGRGVERLQAMGAAISQATRWANLIAVERAYTGDNFRLALELATLQGMILWMAQQRGGQTVRLLTPSEIDAALGISEAHRRINEGLAPGLTISRKEALASLCRVETGKKLADQHRVDAWAVARAAWLLEQRRMIEEAVDAQH